MNCKTGHTGLLTGGLALFILLLSACNPTKYVPKGDHLYTGATIKSTGDPLNKATRRELAGSLKPKPNSKMILGIRFKLFLFNLFKEPKKPKGLIYKIKHKWGEPPVLFSQVNTKTSETTLEAHLFERGWLHAEVAGKPTIKGKTASVKYAAKPGVRYKIRKIYFPSDSTLLHQLIRESAHGSLFRPRAFLNLDLIKNEATRIDLFLKEHGFYFFDPDYLYVKADTLHNGMVDLYLTIREEAPKDALEPWKVGKIFVYANYRSGRDSIIQQQEAQKKKRFWIVDRRQKYRPFIFEKAIELRQDSLYRRYRHTLTIERLMNLGTFRFVRIAFNPEKDSTERLLNTKIYLTPAVKQTVRFEVSGYSKSNHFVGSEMSLTYRNVNLMRGAETFDFKITGGFDWQVGGDQLAPNAQLFSAEANLSIPRLIPGIRVDLKRSPYLPRTLFSLSAEYLVKPDLYIMRSFKFSGGYQWKKGDNIEHSITLLNINYISPSNISAKFDSILNEDVVLRSSFEKQIIVSAGYQFRYDNTYRTNHKFNVAFTGSVESSGNLASALVKAKADTIGAKKLFNVPIAQFVKTELDLRSYWKFMRTWTLATRINAGLAAAYKNSFTPPYSEQFFVGGTSSMRAFRFRTLGPGSYHSTKSVYRAFEAGEVKFEANAELRHDLSNMFKLGIFVDAGNIWFRREHADKPGSGLGRGDFFKEMAVGAGLGLRVDVSVMILRLDLATPLRKPWYPEGKRWVLNEIDFGSRDWRKENLILNIGIGYPF